MRECPACGNTGIRYCECRRGLAAKAPSMPDSLSPSCPTCGGRGTVSEPIQLTDSEHEIARKAVEDVLIEFRDNRLSLPLRRNGLVVAEKDGTPSSVIRLGMEEALRIAIKAINERRADV